MVSVPDLLRLMDVPPGVGYWIFAAIVLLRHLDLTTRQFHLITHDGAAFEDGGAVLGVEGASVVLTHAGCFVD
ncbi:MAG: hypothetical protein Q8K72_01160, partial [Acidimicrobiales bacterium]|nr:hypothetical protein [Acidimicrobiales bacterium]